jgi:hypothetical protein
MPCRLILVSIYFRLSKTLKLTSLLSFASCKPSPFVFSTSIFHCIRLLLFFLNPAGHHHDWISAASCHALHLIDYCSPFLVYSHHIMLLQLMPLSKISYGHVWSEAWDIHPSLKGLNNSPRRIGKKDTLPNGPFLLQFGLYL